MAMEQKYTDLINADIDGEISDVEKADLEVFLSTSAEGRAMHEELAALSSTLDALETEAPPPDLRQAIMNSVAAPAAEAPGFTRNLFASPALRYAAMFAAGIFLTLSLVNSGQISNQAFDDVTDLVGSVADPVNADVVSSLSVNEAEIAGTVSLRSAGFAQHV